MTQRATIIGAGTIGPSLALTFAVHGFATTLVGRRPEVFARAQAEADRGFAELEQAGLLPEAATGWRERLRFECDLAAGVAGADIVVDAISEDVAAKQALFAAVEPLTDESSLLASTTSGMPVDQIFARVRRPGQVVVTHFANPPHLMPAVEIVPGSATSPDSVDRACAFVVALGKEPVRLVRDIPGHIFNRLQFALFREALALVRDGVATPAEIDRIVKHGYALRLPIEGPFEKADLIGLPLMASIARYLFPTLDNSKEPEELDRLIAAGRLGSKSGRGVHDWRNGEAHALINDRNAEVIRHLQRLRRSKPA